MIYLAYSTMIDVIGFNPTTNQMLITSVEFVAFPLLIVLSNNVPRRSSALILFSISAVICLILLVLKVPSNCNNCYQVYLQMILLLITRFFFVFQISLFNLSGAELYPVTVRSIAFGIGGLLGAIGTLLSQIVFIGAQELGVSPFLILMVIFIIMIGSYVFLPETLGAKNQDQIEEVLEEKSKVS